MSRKRLVQPITRQEEDTSMSNEIIGAVWDITLTVRTDPRVPGMSTLCAGTEKKFSFSKSRLSSRDLETIEKTFEDCRRSQEAVVSEDYSSSTALVNPE